MSELATIRVPSPAPWWRSGKAVVAGLAVVILVGLVLYRQTLPPTWLRAFAADIALRAAADPNPPLPEDAREASPRGLADNPLICLQRLLPPPWDRVVFVTHTQGKDLTAHPTLGVARWATGSAQAFQAQLAADDRYQLVALMNGGEVRDAQLFYTFWADLSGLARPEGFAPEAAIFTAASLAGRYVLTPAAGATLADCPKETSP